MWSRDIELCTNGVEASKGWVFIAHFSIYTSSLYCHHWLKWYEYRVSNCKVILAHISIKNPVYRLALCNTFIIRAHEKWEDRCIRNMYYNKSCRFSNTWVSYVRSISDHNSLLRDYRSKIIMVSYYCPDDLATFSYRSLQRCILLKVTTHSIIIWAH